MSDPLPPPLPKLVFIYDLVENADRINIYLFSQFEVNG